jgi:small ligand-binding sensory domain FIST
MNEVNPAGKENPRGVIMPFVSLLSTQATTAAALKELLRQAEQQVEGAVDLALCFFSPHHLANAPLIAETLAAKIKAQVVFGCPGETIIGNGREVENAPALGLWQVTPFHLTVEQTSEGYSLLGWPDALEDAEPAQSLLLTLADPFSFPVDDFLEQVNEGQPGLRVVGGMASGGQQPGEHRLFLGDRIVVEGAVGALLQGDLRCRSVVSQGCRPIGKPFVVTKARDNFILELGGKTPLEQLQNLWNELGPRDQRLVQQGLHVGRVISEYRDSFQRGDFLVRNVLGFDRDTGALAITDRIRVGQTVQFHVRDAATADEDLRLLLQMDNKAHTEPPKGALLFSCNGRGTRLFSAPNHDASVIQETVGPLPLAGFFAQGELGPVGGQNFIHGFTASVLLFDE